MLRFDNLKERGNKVKQDIYNKEVIKKTDYIALKLIPTTSTKNEKTGDIAKKINSIHQKFNKRYNLKKFEIEQQAKIGFLIKINKENISFYMILPREFKTEMETTLENVWKGVNTEIIEKDEIPKYDSTYTLTALETELEDALSLRVNKKDNYLLSSVLSVVNILNETDNEEVSIFYNFMPKSSVAVKNARAKMKETNDKIKQNYSVKKKKDALSMTKNLSIQATLFISDIVTDVMKDFGINNVKANSKDLTKEYFQQEVSEESKKKMTKDLVFTQIAIFSKSDKGRKRQIDLNSYVADNYNKITLDNDITYKHKKNNLIFKRKEDIPKEFNIFDYQLKDIPYNVFSIDECQHFISLPGKSIMEEYPMIESIAYKQSIIEKCCQSGYLSLGNNVNRKVPTPVFLSDEDVDTATNGVYLIGPQGCGKSTYFKSYICDAVAHGDVVVVLDYIGTNELARDIEAIIPSDRLKIINLSADIDERTQALAFNELDVSNVDKNRYKDSKKYEQRVIENLYSYSDRMSCLLDGINGEGPGGQLTNKMASILRACCIITFSKPNQTINDLYKVITNHKIRHQYIEEMPEFIKEEVQDELDELSMKLDVVEFIKDEKTRRIVKDENGEPLSIVVGTNEGAIINFLDRFNQLKRNYVMKRLLKIDPSRNIDFTDFISKGGQCVIVKIPEKDYTQEAASVISSFYANKILLAIQERKARYEEEHPEDPKALKLPICHLVLDEVHKVPTAYTLLSQWFTQFRKYRMKPVLAGHYVGQLSEAGVGKQGINRLFGTNFNYVIFKGLHEEYFNELKSKFKGFTAEDVEDLPRYHAIVSGYYSDGTKVFVTKLPNDVAKVGHPLFNKK